MDEWMAYGLPGTGHTYCQGSCNCSLLPEDLLSIDADVLEPFEIKSALDAFPLVTDPIEAARIAANIRIWAEFTEGGRVRYEGPIRPLRGSVGRLRPGGSPERGVVVDFDIESIPTTHNFPEFAEVHVYDLTDLIPVGG